MNGVESDMTLPKARVHSHRDLIVWQRAMELVAATYRLTTQLPHHELYGLTSQMRRSAVSIAANIAEGQARRTTKDYLRFLAIANGSLRELETYWDVAVGLEYLTLGQVSESQVKGEEIGKMLAGLAKALRLKAVT